MTTAIIVNDKGEVFTHWASACSIDVNGCESYHSVPNFARTTTLIVGPNDFRPSWMTKNHRRHFTINKPYLFNSEEAAAKAKSRMWGCGRLAVVT